MDYHIIAVLCFVSFFAGFIDAIVGGGGLIQSPIALIALPNFAVSQILGTLKIPALCGTSLAAWQYLKKVKIHWQLNFIMTFFAFLSAFLGSHLLLLVNNNFMKPFLVIVLVLLAIYTFLKKDMGQQKTFQLNKKEIIFWNE